MPKRPTQARGWVRTPPKPAKPRIPEAMKAEVTARANELVETVLKYCTIGSLLAACVVTRADPDLMASGHELTSDLKAKPSVRSGDE